MATRMVFVSHETYTPARGGSASAEALALRRVFGADADRIVIANTKGHTGHPMAVGIEDVLAVKILETGIVPPVANFREVDPELGVLNLSRGGSYPVDFALRLGAGFGSQVAMSLFRWNPPPDGARRARTSSASASASRTRPRVERVAGKGQRPGSARTGGGGPHAAGGGPPRRARRQRQRRGGAAAAWTCCCHTAVNGNADRRTGSGACHAWERTARTRRRRSPARP
jgi:hypothetical protein